MSDDPGQGSRGVQAVETGFALLAHFTQSDVPPTAAELARRSGLSKAQVHAYLVSLQNGGMVTRDAASGRYRIGDFGLELGMARLFTMDPQVIATNEAMKLAQSIGHSISLAVWGQYGPTVTAVLQARDDVRNSAQAGTVYSVTGTATGRLFAAFMDVTQCRAIAARQLAETHPVRYVGACPPFDEIAEHSDTVRRTGVSITYSFPQPGVTAIAAPVYNFSDEIELAVTMLGAAEQLDIALDGVHVNRLRELAATISRKLGHVPPPDV